MSAPKSLERIARAAAARPLLVLALVGALAIAGGVLALGLKPSTGTDTLASRSSSSYQATQELHDRFGDDAVDVLVRESLPQLVLTDDLGRLLQLEGCLGGNVPAGGAAYGGAHSACAAIAKLKPTHVVYGPATFLNESANAIQQAFTAELAAGNKQISDAGTAALRAAKRAGLSPSQQAAAEADARTAASRQASTDLQREALSSGLQGIPQLDNKAFVSQIVFDPERGANVPKAQFAYLFPSSSAALIQVRLRPNLTQAQRERAIALIRAAVRMPMFASKHGGSFVVSGIPVVVSDLSHSLTGAIAGLLVGAIVAMAVALLLVFRVRRRLLPLVIALAATGLTFGAMAVAGIALTMASIAVLPVLIGLAVDYAIQFQSRVEEERVAGFDGAEAVGRAARAGAPTIATAALATATGFLVLLLSPIPMVQGFGLLLVIGVVLAFGCALTAGSAALALGGRRRAGVAGLAAAGGPGAAGLAGAAGPGSPAAAARSRRPLPGAAAAARAGRAVTAAARGASAAAGSAIAGAVELLRVLRSGLARVAPLRAIGRATVTVASPRAILRASLRRPGRVLAAAFVLAAIGWGLETQTRVVSDVTKLVPANLPALRDLTTLQDATNSSGEIDVVLTGANLTDPAVIRWMTSYQQRVLRRFGYDAAKDCRTATLCPAFSLPDLLGSSTLRSRASVTALLDAVPAYFSSAVITSDRRAATLAFGIRLMGLDQQQRVIDAMRAELHPPAGVRARLAGLPVLAAQANAQLSSAGRRLLTLLAGLAAVALVLLAIYRRPRRALAPLVPIALATGWSALVLWATRVPLNPLSAMLGALVIAISTEFSVLLSERFHQERSAGGELREALVTAYRSTGRAVLASGVTAIVGFGVLAFSDIRMLSDFGIVTVVDLTVSLLGVLAVLPSVLVLADRGLPAGGPLAARRRRRAARAGRRRAGPAPVA